MGDLVVPADKHDIIEALAALQGVVESFPVCLDCGHCTYCGAPWEEHSPRGGRGINPEYCDWEKARAVVKKLEASDE